MRSIGGLADRLTSRLGLGPALAVALGLLAPAAWTPATADDVPGGGEQEVSLRYQGFDPEQFLASADPDQIALMDGARTQTMGTYAVGMLFHLSGPPLDICVRDRNAPDATSCQVLGDILNSRLRADLGVLYGLGRFDVRLALPMVLYQTTDFEPVMGQPGLSSAGVGNPRVSGRVQLARPADFGFAFDLGVQIPTGQANFIGDEGMIVDPRLLIDWRRGPLSAGLDLGYRYRATEFRVANLYVDDEVTWSAAASYDVLPRKLSVGLAGYGRLGLSGGPVMLQDQQWIANKLGPEEFPAEILGSGRYFLTPQIALDLGVGTGLTEGYGAAPYRVLAGVRLIQQKAAPLGSGGDGPRKVGDKDRDGVGDDEDQCPTEKEDEDGFQDTDGCPEIDNDEDGKLDAQDKCPLAAEDKDGFEDGDGCPDYDNDADGVSDDEDRCPMEAEDMDGFQDDDGCPDLDRDQDGVADDADRCPEEAGTAATAGCPVVDADGDNVTDDVDGCPQDAETLNGVLDADGCPDAVLEVEFDKARVRSASTRALKALASSLRSRGTVKVRIEGHTRDADEKLNRQRAEAVMKVLIKEGVAAGRLEARGFPPSPDASGIVFVIVGTQPAVAPTPATTGEDEIEMEPEVTPPAPPVRPTPPPPAPPAPPVRPAAPAAADADGDTVPDSADRCPRVKEDVDGFNDGDGCPDPDNDGDTIPDIDDRCPGQAGVIGNKGCPTGVTPPAAGTTGSVTPAPATRPAPTPAPTPAPAPAPAPPADEPTDVATAGDGDGDGLDDASDQCKGLPETQNGVQDDDGCPDALFEVVFDGARVRSKSHAAMKTLAASIKSRGNVRVRIEGRTKDADEKLNQRRADSVVKFLVKNGVKASQFVEAKGYPPADGIDGMIFILLEP